MRNPHPWRATASRVPTIDPVVNSRSSQFAAYLETLPREERREIEAAERAYVTKANLVTSTQKTVARDHSAGMLGVKENEPARYVGFVV